MSKYFKYLSVLIVSVLISSCANNERDTMTYFGGKIINPKSEFVLLYNQGTLIDSLFLDASGKFIGAFKDLKENLYTFKHGNEFQHVYVSPHDSILIRLNTWDFDETLVFSGKGADKNNILTDWFLEGEKETKKVNNYYKLSANLFSLKMDSLLQIRKRNIDHFKSRNNTLSEHYLNILDMVANYPIFIRYEAYPRRHQQLNNLKEYPKPPGSFYDFRDQIDLNIDSLKYVRQYTSYIAYRLYNNVYERNVTRESSEFLDELLNEIDTNISNENLKNVFLYEMLVKDFLEKSTCGLNKKTFLNFFKLSSNIEDKKQVQRIQNDVNNLHGNSPLTSFDITDYLKINRDIRNITKNKNSVIHFWTPKYTSHNYLKKRFNYLKKAFPDVHFILVKISDIHTDHVRGIDIKNQYYLDNSSKANSFLTSKLPRTILVNKQGTVINGYANIRSRIFNNQVENLQKE